MDHINRNIAKRAISAVFGTLSTQDIERIASANKAIETANWHYGLNAQVACNQNLTAVIDHVLDNMSGFYIRELAGKIVQASRKEVTPC